MNSLAHAGHWLAQLLYLVPVVAMLLMVLIGKFRARGQEDESRDA
jgi:hypothetical protein